MKLLIITQVIDTQHPILGFFHRWVEEFAKHCEHVHVIALQVGEHSLPENVTVHSLGKEDGKGRLMYLYRFYKLIWQLRHEYDNVFVHMNQIYIILGAPVWKVLGKKIGLWYMHGTVSWSLKLAEKLTDNIFTGSKESCRLLSKKIIVTGHGVDTEHFKYNNQIKDLDIITVGRISEAKNVMQQVDVLKSLNESGSKYTLTIVGGAVTKTEQKYEEELKIYIKNSNLTDSVIFTGKVPQTDLPALLSRAKVFLTTAQNGSLDKAILEAMSVGLAVVSMAPGSVSLPLGADQVRESGACMEQLSLMLQSGGNVCDSHASYVASNHSLQSLVPKIMTSYEIS
jgi:glycosyltransferase involved in cell wall biosynthesis